MTTSITTLDLTNTYLDGKTGAELAQEFAAIPSSITTLNLSYNYLYHKTGAVLAQAFAAIPLSVKTLILSRNHLGLKTGMELARAFSGIPATVTTLILSNNDLYRKTGTEWAQVFTHIPASIATLDLSNNMLCIMGAELAQVVKPIPASVTEIDLSGNSLGNLSSQNLVQAFEALPVSVTKLKLSKHTFTTHAQKTQEIRLASVNTLSSESRDQAVAQLKLSAAIYSGLFFCGVGLISRPQGFDQDKLKNAIICFSKGYANSKNETQITLPIDMALTSVGKFLTPVDVGRLLMTCKSG